MKRTRYHRGQELAMKVLSARAIGGSISTISKDLGITTYKVRKALDHISTETRDALLSDFVAQRIPLNVAESLELNRIIVSKAMQIVDSNSDARVKIEGLRLASQVSESSAKILSDANMLGRAISRSALIVHRPQPPPTESIEVSPP